ncbi:IucA/IucC family C-terminal-domain containing protein [Geomicrobium sp. JCM 19038]|uniref:IucA/IucC family C-terminal-domain containing protein n=1 Tax=Geomicrobium sp. JCM 19038 TaxID=1460635 RepID=UPI00045F1237|nr:IucA/IucC family C-terminal-domain containing protein [Geomicrobium sp. JCM 19038]GAK08377.1 hypothetical protein JCM19038_2160 [Geomicrobium sp. JCM 19038]
MRESATIERLASFGIERYTSNTTGFRMDHLLDPLKCRDFLTSYMEKIEAPNIKVAASLFIKYYARVTVGSLLYSLGNYNQALSMPLTGCVFNEERKKLCIQERECPWDTCPAENRIEWRDRTLQTFFTEHMTPLIRAISTVRISTRILWENIAIRIHSVYRSLLQSTESWIQREQLLSDFQCLQRADGSLFGLDTNPLQPFLQEEAVLGSACTRKTCCLFHRIENKKEDLDYCKICPLERSS